MTRVARWVSLFLLSLGALLILVVSQLLFVFPGWDAESHNALDDRRAEDMATRELIRWSRKTNNISTELQIIGSACLVARSGSERFKMFVFDFTRKDIIPMVLAVYVASSPDDLEIEVTSAAPRGADGRSEIGDYVPNCGK